MDGDCKVERFVEKPKVGSRHLYCQMVTQSLARSLQQRDSKVLAQRKFLRSCLPACLRHDLLGMTLKHKVLEQIHEGKML